MKAAVSCWGLTVVVVVEVVEMEVVVEVEVVVEMDVVVVEVVEMEVGHLSEVRGHVLSCSRPSQAPSQLALVIGRTAGPDGQQVQMEASKLWSGSGLLDPEAQAKMFRARGGARGRLRSSKVTDTHTAPGSQSNSPYAPAALHHSEDSRLSNSRGAGLSRLIWKPLLQRGNRKLCDIPSSLATLASR
ncbi:unnamed protein product [Arctogadus glacialis]